MSDSTQQWILKPFKILSQESYANPYKGGLTDTRWRIEYSASTKDNSAWQTGYIQFCDNAHADEMFQPLDIPAIEKQLEEIANKTSVRIAHDLQYEERTWDEDRAIVESHVSDLISELKVLFGLENKEKANEN